MKLFIKIYLLIFTALANANCLAGSFENIVKEKAKYITKSNIENGVGYFINEYFNLGL